METISKGPAHQELRKVIASKDYTCTSKVNPAGFVLFDKFKTNWLLSTSPTLGDTWFNHLLSEAHPNETDKESWAQKRQALYSSIKPDRLRTFCILAMAGFDHLVDPFIRRFPEDKAILVESELRVFLASKLSKSKMPSVDALATNFINEQWKFKPAEFSRGMKLSFQEQRIIPISSKERITDNAGMDKGGVARVFRIEIPEEYVEVDSRAMVSAVNRRTEDGVVYLKFALKEFSRRDDFDRETNAFAGLGDQNTGLVKLFGHYDQEQPPLELVSGQTLYHMILEHCDTDLDDWLKRRHSPQLPELIDSFWFELFHVAIGLRDLHNYEVEGQRWNGWHYDVKPDNILKVGDEWKLGDPGFASQQENNNDEAPRRFSSAGTRTWGAPETHLNRNRDPVLQNVDIWSLGCVFSVAATWVVLGPEALPIYTELRGKAIREFRAENRGILLVEEGDHFHDGSKVLSTVADWHKYLKSMIRKADTVTESVLDLVEKGMLTESRFRMTSKALCDGLNEIRTRAGAPKSMFDPSFSKDLRDVMGMTGRQAMPFIFQKQQTTQTIDTLSVHQETEQTRACSSHHVDPPPPVTDRRATMTVTDDDWEKVKRTTLEDIKKEYGFDKPKTSRAAQKLAKVAKKVFRWEKGSAPDEILTMHNNINSRDFIFLVDNSAGMSQHWDNLIVLAECIFRKLVDFDKDGIDLDFLCTTKTINACKSCDVFMSEIHKQAPHEQKVAEVPIGVAKALGTRFDDYRNRLDRSILPMTKYPPPKEVTLLVFTNGLWLLDNGQKDHVETAIIGFVKELSKDRRGTIRTRGFSIQFIQFGDDEKAKRLLVELDDGIEAKCGEDIVDYEPWNGRFYKIILGSIMKAFDDL